MIIETLEEKKLRPRLIDNIDDVYYIPHIYIYEMENQLTTEDLRKGIEILLYNNWILLKFVIIIKRNKTA